MSHSSRIPEDRRSEGALQLAAHDADLYMALYAVSTSEGGQILLKSLAADSMAAIEKLAAQYATLPEAELRATCAKLSSVLSLFRAMRNAPHNLQTAQAELEELLSS